MSERDRYTYAARKSCGCVMGAVVDMRDKFTADSVAEFIAAGASIERVKMGPDWRRICDEPTFMACPHGRQSFDPEER